MTANIHAVVFPEDISEGSSGGPGFLTNVVGVDSGDEARNIKWAQARCSYDVAYGIRTSTDMALVLSFFYARYGKAFGFLYKDWSDYSSALAPTTPVTAFDQIIGSGNAVATQFQLKKTYSSGGFSYVRTITRAIAVQVAVAGVEQISPGWTFPWSYSVTTGLVTFTTAPSAGTDNVKAGFKFYVPVRFETDSITPVLDDSNILSIGSIPLIEIRECS